MSTFLPVMKVQLGRFPDHNHRILPGRRRPGGAGTVPAPRTFLPAPPPGPAKEQMTLCDTIPVGMIKAITLIKRNAELTVEEFQDYWLHRHVNVIGRLPGVRRYVQNHPLPENYAHTTPLYDGIAELWADNTDAFRNMAADTAYANVITDEAVFLDRNNLELILTSEHVVTDGPAPADGIKLIEFFRRSQDTAAGDFQHYWLEIVGPSMNERARPRRFVQSPVRPGGYADGRSPVFDGMSSMWFDSPDDLIYVKKPGQPTGTIEGWKNFIAARFSLVCREYVLITGE